MSHRVTRNVVRPEPVPIVVNGDTVMAYEGESIATALLAAGLIATYRDPSGRVRGPFCNMGICCDCMVLVADPAQPAAPPRRVKSCLVAVRAGVRVTVPDDQAPRS